MATFLRFNSLPNGHKGLTMGLSQVDLSPAALSWVELGR